MRGQGPVPADREIDRPSGRCFAAGWNDDVVGQSERAQLNGVNDVNRDVTKAIAADAASGVIALCRLSSHSVHFFSIKCDSCTVSSIEEVSGAYKTRIKSHYYRIQT